MKVIYYNQSTIFPTMNQWTIKFFFTTTNIDALDINNEILSKLSGEKHTYYSLDTAHDQNCTN